MSIELRPQDREALSRISSRWWSGPDEGKEITLSLRFRMPTTRQDIEALELFGAFLEALSGGYPWRASIPID